MTHRTLISPSRHTTSFQRLYDVYTTSATSYRRRKDVETTSCVYWGSTLIEHTMLTHFPKKSSGNVTGNFRNSHSEGTLF